MDHAFRPSPWAFAQLVVEHPRTRAARGEQSRDLTVERDECDASPNAAARTAGDVDPAPAGSIEAVATSPPVEPPAIGGTAQASSIN